MEPEVNVHNAETWRDFLARGTNRQDLADGAHKIYQAMGRGCVVLLCLEDAVATAMVQRSEPNYMTPERILGELPAGADKRSLLERVVSYDPENQAVVYLVTRDGHSVNTVELQECRPQN